MEALGYILMVICASAVLDTIDSTPPSWLAAYAVFLSAFGGIIWALT
jgi:hypothetical protein